jgi:tRNA modification GTPase
MSKAISRTIAAIATPPGEGGISIIRISGKDAIPIADTIFSGSVSTYATHTAHFGQFLDIDEGILLVMKAPKSYTGDDTVELNCHGGSLVTRRLLEAVYSAGAEPAGPGEFTYRAFINGKLDLAQAEAVQSMIGAKNTLALQAAKEQLSGHLSDKISTLQKELLDTAAILEAWVDFPEEGLEFASKKEVICSLLETRAKMGQLAATFHEGYKIQEGIKLCIVGPPNVGKSSLMNTLLGYNRAIVTPIAGTTRDLLDAELTIGGLHFHLIDTAGIRQADGLVEQEGIKRSKQAMHNADLILQLIDASKGLTTEDEVLIAGASADKTIAVFNKIDLPHKIPTIPLQNTVPISARTGQGVKALKATIQQVLFNGKLPQKGEIILTNQRHKRALSHAINDLDTLINGLQTDISVEFLSTDMRSCLNHLCSIMGMDISEDILSTIFAKFCVGK